jgi:DNA-binding beta-propeller fold protein YncE
VQRIALSVSVGCSLGLLLSGPAAAAADLMLSGNDQKVTWDEAGKIVASAPGGDTVSLIDIGTDPAKPRIVAELPLMNSIFGPPTNLAITPDGKLALVANSMRWEQEGQAWAPKPDNKVYVIDLEASPPAHIATVEVGDQPSGMAISKAGDLALVANRASKNVSVLAIRGREVDLVGNVDMGDVVAAVAIAPDGRRALAAKFPSHKIALLEIDGQTVTYGGHDIPVGLWPYNVAITPDGKLALTADNGASGASDGHVDTVSVIDLEADPPRVIDKVVVGDAPEGLAISPTGELAVAVLLKGSGAVARDAWFRNDAGSVVALRIDGKRVTRGEEVAVGRLPEGVVFSRDGSHLYVGNFIDGNVSVLRIEGGRIADTGQRLKLPGHPASMRAAWP